MPSLYTLDLLQLVRQMSGPEKAYFKKMAKRHAHQNQALHLRLFDLIENSDHNDEDLFQKKLGLTTKAHYSSLKKYLTKEILDTIIFLQRNDNPEIQLQFYVLQIGILLERNLGTLAQKLYKQAIRLAEEFNAFDMRMKLLMLRRRLLEHASYKEYHAESTLIDGQLREDAEKQRNLEKNQWLFERLHTLSKAVQPRLEEEQLHEIRLLEEELNEAGSGAEPLPGILHGINRQICAYLSFRFEEAGTRSATIVEFWEAHPHFIMAYPRYFLKSAEITFYNDFARKLVPDAVAHWERYKQLATGHLGTELHFMHWVLLSFNTQLKIFHKTGQYDAVSRLIRQEAQQVQDAARSVLSPAEQLSVMGSIAISHFVLEQWDDAENMVQSMKDFNRQVQREDIMHFSMLFHLLVLYEKKEWYRLDNAAEAAYHYLYTKKKLRPFEKDLMLFIRKLPATRMNGEAKAAMSNFLQKLDTYKNDPVKQLYFLYFNYYGWLESKVMGVSYRHYAEQKIREEQAALAPGF